MQRSRRCRFAHLCTKISIFSLCVGVLMKNANTGAARKHKSKKILLSATHLGSTKFQAKTLLLSSPAARGGKAAGDALDRRRLSPQPALKRGTEREAPEGTSGRVSSATSCRVARSGIKKHSANAHEVQCERQKEQLLKLSTIPLAGQAQEKVVKTTQKPPQIPSTFFRLFYEILLQKYLPCDII